VKEAIRQAVVLAGGLGIRLRALTEKQPKPLLPVAGRPFLEWLLDNLSSQGVANVVLAIGHGADVFSQWLERLESPMKVETFIESEPLGTGGALPLMRDQLEQSFFLLNGDTMFDASLASLERALLDSGTLAAVALRSVPDTARYGRVTLDGSKVVGFAEKRAQNSESREGLTNGGIYAFRQEAIGRLGTPSSIETELLPALVLEGALSGVVDEGFFVDIGLPETYSQAQTSVPEWWQEKLASKKRR
jgi:D-glycero-D-manno-heptose 1,7-bisphosphate phosphatase